jgi:hypothetical protein
LLWMVLFLDLLLSERLSKRARSVRLISILIPI